MKVSKIVSQRDEAAPRAPHKMEGGRFVRSYAEAAAVVIEVEPVGHHRR